MAQVRVMARGFVRPGREAEARAVFRSMLAPTRAEEGCLFYEYLESVPSSRRFFGEEPERPEDRRLEVYVNELWAGQEAQDAHVKTPYFAEHKAGLARVIDGDYHVTNLVEVEPADVTTRHAGVTMTGEDGAEGPKAFSIRIEARPGRQDDVLRMLRDIRACVEDEPATGPWYAVRHSETEFAIFEAFPTIAGRNAHIAGGGGDVFRDIERMNTILATAAHVRKVDVLLSKETIAK
ncbi:antibiotic biosynthesis monooxygenase [Amycolatopsis sp. NPDC088138]|uniref:antibiotic biosynthesis monooxygenase n=1 Tax=Amycolatopsis sp. NPDC088138 TaxID=3363938 RepID=UPI00382B2B45